MMTGAIFAALLLAAPSAFPAIAQDKSAAVIFVYQRIGEDTVPQSNISVDQFKEHLSELLKDGYSVLPLGKIVDAIRNGDPLPPKTVGITFEGAYQTTLANAIPLLKDAQMPYTVFFAADAIDDQGVGRMTWDQIKALHKDKLTTLGILPAAYEHMVNLSPEKNAELINRAVGRYKEMLGEEPSFFAYPYGEYSTALKKQLAGYKFKAVFGQQSGVAHSGSDLLALPRFTMTNDYGDLDRFMVTANALPLPVTDVIPEDSIIAQNPPTIGFTTVPEVQKLDKLSCFASGQGKLPLVRIGGNRIEIRPAQPFTDRRTRINCTLPNDSVAPGDAQNWRWFGLLLTSPGIEEDASSDGSAEGEEEPRPGSNEAPDKSDQN